MYPPLPPFSVYPQQPRNPRHHQHAMAHYAQTAIMRMPLQAWQPHDGYGNNFVIVPSHYQPHTPWKPTANPRVKKPARTVVATATKIAKTEKIERTEKAEKAVKRVKEDKSQETKSTLKEDNQADHEAAPSVATTAATASTKKPADAIVWPQDRAVVLFATSPEQIKSIWTTTPLELSSMMLLARHSQQCSRKPKEKKRSRGRSNQETHEISSSSSSDSSVDDGSSTDTEDDDVPVLKQYYGLQSLERFVCDADYEIRRMSPSSEPRDDKEAEVQALLPPPSNAYEAPDYRKLFGLAADAVPFCPSSAPTSSDSSAEMNDDGIPPPHMMWWPGDWKCSSCGNHNFSYRETCKRCREGRIVEAGFIFTIPSC